MTITIEFGGDIDHALYQLLGSHGDQMKIIAALNRKLRPIMADFVILPPNDLGSLPKDLKDENISQLGTSIYLIAKNFQENNRIIKEIIDHIQL